MDINLVAKLIVDCPANAYTKSVAARKKDKDSSGDTVPVGALYLSDGKQKTYLDRAYEFVADADYVESRKQDSNKKPIKIGDSVVALDNGELICIGRPE